MSFAFSKLLDSIPAYFSTTVPLGYSNLRSRISDKGPKINTQDQAMRVLGIGTEVTDEGAKPVTEISLNCKTFRKICIFKQVPLSTYSQNDVLEAFRRKLKEGNSKTNTMQDVHESYQV